MPDDDEPLCCLNCDWVANDGSEGPLSEEDVAGMIEGMRARGELGFRSEEEVRKACALLDRQELTDVVAMYWKKAHEN